MIVVSDDACGVAGLRMVGRGALDPALRRQGFTGTHLGSPQSTTANDVSALLLRARTSSPALYDLLRRQEVNDRLPRGLPSGTPIAHKTGDRTGWAHDAGIITGPRGEFLLVVMTGPWPAPCCHAERPGRLEAEAFGTIASVGRAVYDHFA
jgi:beta-lactamase class A